MKKITFILSGSLLFFAVGLFAQQAHLNIATDFDFLHSFKKEQRYWAVGQTVQTQFNFTGKEGLYVWLSYYSNGKFHNNLAAIAKSSTINPQQINFVNNAIMRYKQVSIGWKHYLKGAFDNENSWNLYGYAGFGLMLGRIENSYSTIIDTVKYSVPVNKGKANFKRLTLDLGLGWEIMLGSGVYFYNEARVEIPTTDYPSPYLFVNRNAPLVASINCGIRILLN
ncbi:MAG TPA: hypothetical protein VHD35_07720 [Chitinophagaceae bacterium]|nr:hypothetical protein [Chitinophagaceae bacterium]